MMPFDVKKLFRWSVLVCFATVSGMGQALHRYDHLHAGCSGTHRAATDCHHHDQHARHAEQHGHSCGHHHDHRHDAKHVADESDSELKATAEVEVAFQVDQVLIPGQHDCLICSLLAQAKQTTAFPDATRRSQPTRAPLAWLVTLSCARGYSLFAPRGPPAHDFV
jgi:hypothetical protein